MSVEDDELDSGLLGIALSDSDAEPGEEAKTKKATPEERTAQSEADFLEVKRTYHVKVENGEIWKTICLPLDAQQLSKAEGQVLLHAVEELYFFRRFAEGARLARSVLEDGDAGGGNNAGKGSSKLDADTLKTLLHCERKCTDGLTKEG